MSGEVQAFLAAIGQAEVAETRLIEPGEVSQRATPPGWVLHDVDYEALLDHPRRPRGEIKVRSAKGFIDAVMKRWPADADGNLTDEVCLYADDATQTLVAILNDDLNSQAGWRDHRVALDVRKTEEWAHWRGHDAKLGTQEDFANVIEKGYLEITDPSPAIMLRIAESFEATVGIAFKKGARVRDGAQQYTYEESIDQTAGGGSIEIPEGFTITVAPYIGSPKYVVKAALKTRLQQGKLSMSYTLERPHEVERSAFSDIATAVADGLELTAIEGVAPQAR